MTESAPPHPFDDREALTWLRSQPDGRVTLSAAELGRQWGWNRMRTSRRLKTWEVAGLIRRNAEAIIVTTSVTPAVTEDPLAVTGPVSVTGSRAFPVPGRYGVPRHRSGLPLSSRLLALAGVSATFSIDGLTAIFAGAFWPVVIMGAVLEAGKLIAAAWLTEHWNSAPSLLRLVLVAMVGVLMGLRPSACSGL
jgi:hypothetical protein